jgi:ATP-dependent helicase/nuclease subunit A
MKPVYSYRIGEEGVEHKQFIAAACNPLRSVVVEACAGSGKTWLLVARMLRLLLAGAEPAELLAITFTRKAAQEMRERLDQLLRELALADDHAVAALLTERGVPENELARLLPLARGLYQRVLASPQGLSVDTFHSWFGRLVQIAPLAAGVPHGFVLTEKTGELLDEAYRRFMQSLNTADGKEARSALETLYEEVGDAAARNLLNAFVSKRAEWWVATQGDADEGEPSPLLELRERCGEDGERDARLGLWEDAYLLEQIGQAARLLGQGSATNRTRAIAIETALSGGPSLENFESLRREFFTQAGEPVKNLKTKDLSKALEAYYGVDGVSAFDTEFNSAGLMLDQLHCRGADLKVIKINQALFIAGAAYLSHYQDVKAAQRVFDFTDLEWHAYRLLSDEGHAAYLQSRLDARYRHILLDEFQDTNPLQWNIVRSWLEAYGADTAPSVFIVGDPKQSIYRFRRAEPRVFDGARTLLKIRGAADLRTGETRRNASAIVDLLNLTQTGSNPIYSAQTTIAGRPGAVWRLPLLAPEAVVSEVTGLRNPLTTPREEEDNLRRLDEGRAVAAAIRHLHDQGDEPRASAWRDYMLLVRSRTHLAAYERALREAGIPYVSDRKGGLLDALEVHDLIALLTFLVTPGDDRALAHVLKSPIIGAADTDLIELASTGNGHWWDRLQQTVTGTTSPALIHAGDMLQRWLADAPRLPVHDLLDRILHQGDLMARYAQQAPPAMRAQTLANIEAFVELALSLDAGRYPSIPKFIEALRSLQDGATSEAPDEAEVTVEDDAVRILTIHGAKGLESPVVFLLDSNVRPKRDHGGILCDWPEHDSRPSHFSGFGAKAERGFARNDLFEAEARFEQQEDWNLLYVAATRAKDILVVSGAYSRQQAAGGGLIEGSWYQRMQPAPELELTGVPAANAAVQSGAFSLEGFAARPMPAPPAVEPGADGDALTEGVALHALLERVTASNAWPVRLPEPAAIARWLACTRAMAATVRAQAALLLSLPRLERFFNPALYRKAHNEMEVVVQGETLRFDRVVVFDEEIWILDYKRKLLESEQLLHAAQLARYRVAAGHIFPGKRVRTALIAADGELREIDAPARTPFDSN